ncbi:glycine oxidase ThiO [Tumidithrix helvetica PCC 7403]|uniref:glycine oxidase ThiO n=1 Tax=Tumidithrix helvetica TaxID=3457545 RepID=UPI003C97C6E4
MADVLVIGGGVIGLATALELRQRGATVTVLERDVCGQAATWAAGGMLAPEAERLEGDLRELGIRSRSLYAEWIRKIVHLTGQSCGYWCCGILAPISCSDADAETVKEHPKYIDRLQLDKRQSGLGDSVSGALWLSEDGQVDNRLLARALILALRSLDVEILEGTSVDRIVTQGDRVLHLETSRGKLQAEHYLLATGAWTRSLLPLPISPRKGQMLSVFDPNRSLQTVIFGKNTYLIPRQDGTLVIGATVEDVEFAPGNTGAGMHRLLSQAIALYPAIADMTIQETWWGFRPHAPNEIPILGASHYENLSLATGHYRNGILFAPITAQFLTDWICDRKVDPLLKALSDFR